MEIPYQGRAIVHESFNELKIEIPVKRNWYSIIFLFVWMAGWCFGEIMVIGTLAGFIADGTPFSVKIFMIFWLFGWTIGGVFISRRLIWMIAGKEIIVFEEKELKIEKKGAIFLKPKTYDLDQVKQLSLNQNSTKEDVFGRTNYSDFWNMNDNGILKFDYGMKTIKFGQGIDEAEAKYLLEKTENLSENNNRFILFIIVSIYIFNYSTNNTV